MIKELYNNLINLQNKIHFLTKQFKMDQKLKKYNNK